MSALTLYFLVMLDSIYTFCIILSVILWIWSAVSIIGTGISIADDLENTVKIFWKKCLKISTTLSIIWTFIACMIPSTKQVAFIYVVSSLSQNKIVQDIGQKSLQIPDKALDILNTKMNEYLDDMKKEAEEKAKETVKGK